MEADLRIEVVWIDDEILEILELRVHANNGQFSGTTECYACPHDLRRLADTLRGFPAAASDQRQWEVGTPDATFAGAGAGIELRCVDSAGHAEARVTLTAAAAGRADKVETVSFCLPVEPAELDEFAVALIALSRSPSVGAVASLRRGS